MNTHMSSPHDARNDLGYGVSKEKFHSQRKSAEIYPYIEDEGDLEEFEDEETEKAIGNNSINPLRTDFFSSAGANPFYFVAGNTKLSDCFERPDLVLSEVFALGDSMSPVPANKKGMKTSASSGASFPQGVTSYRRTGSKRGYFSSPPPKKNNSENIPKDDEEDNSIENLRDLARKQDMIKGNFSVGRDIFNP